MNNHAYKVLEFYKIKEVLAKYAITDEAIERILDLEPYSDINRLKKEIDTKTTEMFLLNNVAENYLSNGIIFNTSKTIISPEYLKPFTLITSSGNEKPITFFNDWSYKDRDLTKGTMLSDPITGLVDPRQYLVSS